MRKLLSLSLICWCFACSSSKQAVQPKLKDNQSFLLTEISADATYGYSKQNPVMVGGVEQMEGPLNERRYLNALAGPNGEPVTYRRAGSCCPVKTKNGFMGSGMLDVYLVSWQGEADTVSIDLMRSDYQ